MYNLEVRKFVEEIFAKLAKKNPKQLEIIDKKIKQILENPNRFKPLRFPLAGMRRVHIDKNFVLIYSIDERTKTIILEDYNHHDKVYK